MNFINDIKFDFKSLSDTKTALLTAEKTTIITSIRCTNTTNDNVRITLEDIMLLTHPIQESYICYKLMLTPNQTTDLLMVTKGVSSELVPHKLLNGDSLVCYSDSFKETFSCIVIGYELVES